jgi:hypothetical protein
MGMHIKLYTETEAAIIDLCKKDINRTDISKQFNIPYNKVIRIYRAYNIRQFKLGKLKQQKAKVLQQPQEEGTDISVILDLQAYFNENPLYIDLFEGKPEERLAFDKLKKKYFGGSTN